MISWRRFGLVSGISLLAATLWARGASRPVVGPYLDGQLPERPPRGSGQWATEIAFPHLTFQNPVFVTAPPRGSHLYVCEREGRIYAFRNDRGATAKTLVLDISDRCQAWGDAGLLSLAFHPDFGKKGSPNRGHLYVYYQYSDQPTSGPGRPDPETPTYNRLSRFTIPDGNIKVDPESEQVLIHHYDRHTWHSGGGLFFDKQGYLYVSLGDEGGSGSRYNNDQRIDKNLFAGVLRVDVDRNPNRSHPIRRRPQQPKSVTGHYYIPDSNPFIDPDGGVLEEFYAMGLRSPHRMTYDPVTETIWVGDIGGGGDSREEINVIKKGGNYQWAYREGNLAGPKPKPDEIYGHEQPPVYAYSRKKGSSVIGGYVYRGDRFPELQGRYIFGDTMSGRIWTLDYDFENGELISVDELCRLPVRYRGYHGLSSFGVDQNANFYICVLGENEKGNGRILRLTQAPKSGVGQGLPERLSEIGEFRIDPDSGALHADSRLIPYEVNRSYWSNGSRMHRWIALPNDGLRGWDQAAEQIGVADEAWRFPPGTVFVQHHELPAAESSADRRTPLETRFLVRNPTGAYGVSYRWNEAGTEAFRVDEGQREPVTVSGADPIAFPDRHGIGEAAVKSSVQSVPGGYDFSFAAEHPTAQADDIFFVSKTHTGDFDLKVRLERGIDTAPNAWAGIMARAANDPEAAFAFAFQSLGSLADRDGGRSVGFAFRDRPHGTAQANRFALTNRTSAASSGFGHWLRLRRTGNQWNTYVGGDGIRWRSLAERTLYLPEEVRLGIAVQGGLAGSAGSVSFRDVTANRGLVHYYPSEADCQACHNGASGYVLGVRPEQLNRPFRMSEGQVVNQLKRWLQLGMFNHDIAQTLSSLNATADSGLASNTSSAPLEHKVRSYLDVNCAHCHTPGSTPTHFDARYHREENSTQSDWTTASVLIPFEIDHAGLIVPNDPSRSILLRRLDAGGGPLQMPPVEIATPDRTAIQQIRRWIDSMEGVEALAPPTLTVQANRDVTGPGASVEVKIRHSDPEAAIHYTLNRSDPTPASPRYKNSLQLEESTTVTARAFRDGIRSSVVVSERFEVIRDAVPVNLEGHFTDTLDHGWHDPGRPNNHLQSLPKGRQTFAGVPFSVPGGVVQLYGGGIANEFPSSATGIQIQRELTTLYLFHGTASSVPDGTTIATLKLNYEDGSGHTIPIRYGDHVGDWWQWSEQPPTAANSRVAWRGSNPVTVEKRVQARLYMTAFDNPYPQRKVHSIDYLSEKTKAAPFLIALTTDAAKDYPPNAGPIP